MITIPKHPIDKGHHSHDQLWWLRLEVPRLLMLSLTWCLALTTSARCFLALPAHNAVGGTDFIRENIKKLYLIKERHMRLRQ